MNSPTWAWSVLQVYVDLSLQRSSKEGIWNILLKSDKSEARIGGLKVEGMGAQGKGGNMMNDN